MTVTIYHNPRCSKSRQTLELLQAHDIEPEIVRYLETPPDPETLTAILKQLGLSPLQLMRTGEPEYKAAQDQIAAMSAAEQTAWLTAHPKVIQRPIVVTANRAGIGRPPESILEILDEHD